MSLDQYRQKRKFAKSREPRGETSPGGEGRLFVVQKHQGRRLHYDLRLELDGVLKSWAVPKGPCLDPKERRLAVHVEDHPLEYADFEGLIPKGEYGAGPVLIWDRGEWTPEEDPRSAYDEGKIKFRLDGSKLQGRWMLVRMQPRPDEPDRNWLLIKERDEQARRLDEYDVLIESRSVVSGRTIDEITGNGPAAGLSGESAAVPSAVSSEDPARNTLEDDAPAEEAGTAGRRTAEDRPAKGRRNRRGKSSKPAQARAHRKGGIEPGDVPGAKRAPLPASLKPQLAEPIAVPPEGDRWLHEIKFDGYRLLIFVEAGEVTLRTRRGVDWTHRFGHLAAAAAQLPVESALLDGEVVALLPNGVSSFAALKNSFQEGTVGRLVYFAFDLLYAGGFDLRKVPLERRKELLKTLLPPGAKGPLQYTDHIIGSGPEFFAECGRMGLEGVVSKRRDKPYRSGRSAEWLKAKHVQREEFVVGGFSEPGGSRQGLGAILVGYYHDGALHYAGRVGTGFTHRMLLDLRRRLEAIEIDGNPFTDLPREKIERGTHWVKPELVAHIEFANWTDDALLWHPSFQGLRDDLRARDVVRTPPRDEERDGMRATSGGRRHNAPAGEQERPNARRRSRSARRTTRPPNAEARTPNAEEQRLNAEEDRPDAEDQSPDAGRTSDSGDPLAGLSDVRLTSPGRVMYADPGITKLDLVKFHVEIADWILPHVAGRPISLLRAPDGQGHGHFYQKHAVAGLPDAVHRILVNREGEPDERLMIDDLRGLVSLVQFSVLEIHPWGARADRLERPDRLVFDLDPGENVPWSQVIEAALRLREFLDDLGLAAFVKTSGSKGLHVVVPVDRRHEWEVAKEFTRAVARRLAEQSPDRFTADMAKWKREGRVYVDYLRNRRGATAVAAYSTRALPSASVSVPVGWEELPKVLAADQFSVLNVRERLADLRRDPWEEIGRVRQSITARVRRRLEQS